MVFKYYSLILSASPLIWRYVISHARRDARSALAFAFYRHVGRTTRRCRDRSRFPLANENRATGCIKFDTRGMTERNDKSCGWQFSRSGTLTKPIPPVCRLYTSDPFRTRDFIVLSVVCRGNPVPEYEREKEKEREKQMTQTCDAAERVQKISRRPGLADLYVIFYPRFRRIPLPFYGKARRWHWDKFSATEVSNGKRRSWRAS